jgi:hypothetical protein
MLAIEFRVPAVIARSHPALRVAGYTGESRGSPADFQRH